MPRSAGRMNARGRLKSGDDKVVERTGSLPIVAIGASGGGIEAFAELLSNFPVDTGMAFVLVLHLDPKHNGLLPELFAKKTAMTVKEVQDGMTVEPNHVYIIPADATLSISNEMLRLASRELSRGIHLPIDHFMRSLAEEQGNRSIGVILSGSGTDGTLGMAEIRAQGGVTFAQDGGSAKYNGMPGSAIAAGCVDYVLPPKGIGQELGRIARHPYVARDEKAEAIGLVSADAVGLTSVFQLLRRSIGVDFSHYPWTTVLRRIQRRMVVHKIEKLEDYAKYIQTNPVEIKALYQDVLINVTSFFRNPKVFDALKKEVFPEILKNRIPEVTIRVWTPGCASGEETYSVAIALLECLGDKAAQTPIQFFGTDVSESSIVKARAGLFPENILGDVSTERLRRFFSKVEGGYRISKSIRDMCIFAQHNVLNDPPFSQMDLICCRNLLICLEPALQNRVISLFHYATRSRGFLVLGTAEGIGSATNLFATVHRTHKIFARKTTARRPAVTFSLTHPSERPEDGRLRRPGKPPDSSGTYLEAQKEFDRRLLSQYAPAAVFINEDMEIIHARGNVNRYLRLASGRASLSILKMAREGQLLDLQNAIGKAKRDNMPVRKQNVQLKSGNKKETGRAGATRLVRFEVVPININNLKEPYFMILFEDEGLPGRAPARGQSRRVDRKSEAASVRLAKLERDLAGVKEYLQAVIETQEVTNKELQSANEEILSSNEELQSTNDELATAKEELQSANEELTTVNDELRNRNLEVTQANSDLTNLFGSINVAVVMVARDLTIRRFTPEAQRLLSLIPSDIGRPLLNINPTVEIPEFQALVLQAMSSSRSVEKELRDKTVGRYQLRILPYRTADNKLDGAVITMIRISTDGGTGVA